MNGKNTAFLPFQGKKKQTQSKEGQKILKSFTMYLIKSYKQCSNNFNFKNQLEKILLTNPKETYDGVDNIEGNLLVYTNDIIKERFIIKDLLGCGTFGQVFRCQDLKLKKQCALKIIKNKTAYLRQANIEIKILEILNQEDKEDKYHIVKMETYFIFKNHLCLVFELLSINLYELLKQTRFQGVSLSTLMVMSKQILSCLSLLQKCKIIHCDLKPENILLEESDKPKSLLKVIDFGSACFENETIYSYIQSRFYRSPEVIIGMQYDLAIDMWSLGCICAELFLGLPLFPGVSEYNLLCRMIEMFGDIPSYLLDQGKQTEKYFKKIHIGNQVYLYQLKSQKEVNDTKEWKRYFNYIYLDELIMNKSYKNIPEKDKENEKQIRICFMDFIKGLLQYDPRKRWTAEETLLHPFITGEKYTGPFIPLRKKMNQWSPRSNIGSSPRDIFPIYGTPTSSSFPNSLPPSPHNKWVNSSPRQNKVSPRQILSPTKKDETLFNSGFQSHQPKNRSSIGKPPKVPVKSNNKIEEEEFDPMFEKEFQEEKKREGITIQIKKDVKKEISHIKDKK